MVVDLDQLPRIDNPVKIIEWMRTTYGANGDRWTLRELRYLEFRKDRDADLFLLMWQ